MRNLYIMLFLCLASVSASAETATSILEDNVTTKPSDVTIVNSDSSIYTAKSNSTYKGRGDNDIIATINEQSTTSTATATKSISLGNQSNDIAILRKISSMSGEMVQKVEDDRLAKISELGGLIEDTQDDMTAVYNKIKTIDISRLGKERDPTVNLAFKCKDYRNCDQATARRNIVQCQDDKMLHWSGARWTCISAFNPTIPGVDCSNREYQISYNNGTACKEYIFEWKSFVNHTCVNGYQNPTQYRCVRKRTPSDSGTTVNDSFCYGEKPEGSRGTSRCGRN